jgi:GNAT superfamily N-acetyltransferase
VTERDNRHLAWLDVEIHPDHRRRGHGSRLLERLVADATALGRTVVGLDGWDSPANAGFAAHHGFALRSRDVNRRQHLADVDPARVRKAFDEAAHAAADYELVRLVGRTPDDLLEAVAELAASINDAPTDDLDIEDEVMSGERLTAYEDAMAARGERLYRLVARHRPTGGLAGHTVVVVDSHRPTAGSQHDTAVARAHRGHRLGLLLKAGMLLWLAEDEPQLQTVDTWNAESNDHMIGVNEELGYRVLGRTLVFQRRA